MGKSSELEKAIKSMGRVSFYQRKSAQMCDNIATKIQDEVEKKDNSSEEKRETDLNTRKSRPTGSLQKTTKKDEISKRSSSAKRRSSSKPPSGRSLKRKSDYGSFNSGVGHAIKKPKKKNKN